MVILNLDIDLRGCLFIPRNAGELNLRMDFPVGVSRIPPSINVYSCVNC